MSKHPIWMAYTISSVCLPVWIVYDAFQTHDTIFSMLITLCSSKLNLVIFTNFIGVLLIQFCYLVVSIFFGDIRIIEMQYIIEKSQKKIFYFLLLSIVLRNTFDLYKMASMVVLFMFCILYWLINKRTDYIVSRGARDLNQHVKMVLLTHSFLLVCFIVSYRFNLAIKIAQ